MISLQDYLSASGRYPERVNSAELTPELLKNAENLLERVNLMLVELGIKNVKVSSGFRPLAVNAGVPGSAKKSLHMSCNAIDIHDRDGSLDKLIESRDDLKKKYGLWQESPAATINWCHLDNKNRGVRAKNTFLP